MAEGDYLYINCPVIVVNLSMRIATSTVMSASAEINNSWSGRKTKWHFVSNPMEDPDAVYIIILERPDICFQHRKITYFIITGTSCASIYAHENFITFFFPSFTLPY